MQIPRIMLAATGSGSGKTTITCALLELLSASGKCAAAFKCGPDYIDPMFHREVLSVPSKNLDTYFTGETLTKELFLESAAEKDIAVIEGVMGLYDGLGGIQEEASSYHLAETVGSPVILVIDAHGMGRSLLPLIAGFLQFDTGKMIKGIILNRTGKMFYETIKPEIESHFPVRVLGYFPKTEGIKMESRHLGLLLPGEIGNLKEQIEEAAQILKDTVDIGLLLRIAEEAADIMIPPAPPISLQASKNFAGGKKIPIGIARDEAFCFYYEDNLRLLEKMGAELVPFSPLLDTKLPEGVRGIILGGGYPELYAKELSENTAMKEAVSGAIRAGMPSIAECGGFLYLHGELENEKQEKYRMAGIIRGTCRDTGKLVRFGYVELKEKKPVFLETEAGIKGHEFHYYDSTINGTDCIAVKPVSGRSWEAVHVTRESWWGFAHLYYYSNPGYARYFMERAAEYENA